ncbi:MAG: hypothetical protein KKC43_05670 [Alphaproteobacteria bacterium]|nr:hypothetical protein [Alphaproteobacteria bacterium]
MTDIREDQVYGGKRLRNRFKRDALGIHFPEGYDSESPSALTPLDEINHHTKPLENRMYSKRAHLE